VLEQSELDGSRYLGFVTQLLDHGERGVFERQSPELRTATTEFNRQIARFLTGIPALIRARRIATTLLVISREGAHRERMRALGRRVLPFAAEVADLVDGTVGFLEATVSPEARRAVADLDPSDLVWPSFF
jgi:hypothetical protein